MNNILIYPLVTNISTTYIIIIVIFSVRFFCILHEFVCFLNMFMYFCNRVNAFACVRIKFYLVYDHFHVSSCTCEFLRVFMCIIMRMLAFVYVFCMCSHAFMCMLACGYVRLYMRIWEYNMVCVRFQVCFTWVICYMLCVCMLYNENAWAHSITNIPTT